MSSKTNGGFCRGFYRFSSRARMGWWNHEKQSHPTLVILLCDLDLQGFLR